MTRHHRPRRWIVAALTAAIALGLAACSAKDYPNSTFNRTTEFNTAIDALWNRLMFLGTIVFVLVEAALLFVVFRYRRREGAPPPRAVHGNTTLEIFWTLIPALILVFIAVPTVRTIFHTQARAKPGALQVQVIGHQWWWEFRYPQLGVVTANELYLPVGQTVNFELKTADVLHSFWIPQLAGKRDLISNHTNYLWFTVDSSLATTAYNGFCAEYCGASHANMRFRSFVLSPADFERWVAHQKSPAAFGAAAAPGAAAAAPAPTAAQQDQAQRQALERAAQANAPSATQQPSPGEVSRGQPAAGAQAASGAGTALAAYTFPRERIPAYVVPNTPLPKALAFPSNLTGDPERGRQVYSTGMCIGCHTIAGNPSSMGILGPNLTHVGSRTTIGAGLYPNDAEHLARWIKNAPMMKPGSLMPPLGKGQLDPKTGKPAPTGLYTDQQIADIVAYLQALK